MTPTSLQEYVPEIQFEKHCPSSKFVSAVFSGPVNELFLQFMFLSTFAPMAATFCTEWIFLVHNFAMDPVCPVILSPDLSVSESWVLCDFLNICFR